MKSMIAAGILGLALSSGAFAQTTAVDLDPGQRTQIKEYVVKQKVQPVEIKERIVLGSTIPQTVVLSDAPAAWGAPVAKYKYVYSGSNVYLVDPSSRRVVQVIE